MSKSSVKRIETLRRGEAIMSELERVREAYLDAKYGIEPPDAIEDFTKGWDAALAHERQRVVEELRVIGRWLEHVKYQQKPPEGKVTPVCAKCELAAFIKRLEKEK